MQKWVLFGILIGISVAIGLGIWILFHGYKTNEFLTEEEAIENVKNKDPYYYVPSKSQPEFGFLKYNGTQNGDPRFMIYQADTYSGTISKKEGSSIFYEGQYGPIVFTEGEYLPTEVTDRFVWILFDDNIPIANQYFVDAQTGEFIGLKRGEGYCHGKCRME